MESIPLGPTSLTCSRLAYGCWRIAGTWEPAEVTLESESSGCMAVITAYESGFTLFDHADIYCDGRAESIFGRVLKEIPTMREDILVATKCGIRCPGDPWSHSPHRYDFSAEHIVKSCEGSLQRLGVDKIDLFLLHRPDYLADPDEIATAFSQLKEAGKVQEFGVSNFRPSLITALQKSCPMRLVVNQVEISLGRLDCFTDGTLDQCLAEKMTPMAWSPLAGGVLGSHDKAVATGPRHTVLLGLQQTLDTIAEERGVSRAVVALAWLLKHPSGILPIVGTTNPDRIRDAARSPELELTRDEWYRLLTAARGERLP